MGVLYWEKICDSIICGKFVFFFFFYRFRVDLGPFHDHEVNGCYTLTVNPTNDWNPEGKFK